MDAILQRLSKLTDAELRQELTAAGQPCGAIAKTTRKFFEKRFAKHLLKTTETNVSSDDTDNASKTMQKTSSEPDQSTNVTQRPSSQTESSDITRILSDDIDVSGVPAMGECVTTILPKLDDSRTKNNVRHTKILEKKLNGHVPSDNLFYVVQIPPEAMEADVPDAPMFKAPLCNGRVYRNRKEAFDVMKKNKTARFKVFKSFDKAEEFVTSNQDLSTPKRPPEPASNQRIKPASESANSFYSPKNQQLVRLRKAIEANDIGTFKDIVWNNPRYLISSGDTPTIMKEGPRYNALHVTALANLAPMCRLILETLEDSRFFAMMYPEDSPEMRQKRQEVLVDLYLNTPDKGNGETPLHFASKFGNPEVLSILVNHIMCDKTAKNKYGQTPKEIACSRNGNDIIKSRIIHLLEDNYYVPVLRSEDNSTQAVIGEPWSPDQSPLHQMLSGVDRRDVSPIEINICTRAYAGPMSPSKAETFHKHLRTPPSAESKRAAAIRRADGDKGLERVARELARSLHVPWAEYWEFLDAYVDLASKNGLEKLEKYLQERQAAEKEDMNESRGDKTTAIKEKTTISEDIISNLMEDFEKLSVKSNDKSISPETTADDQKSVNKTGNTVSTTMDIDNRTIKSHLQHVDDTKKQQTIVARTKTVEDEIDLQACAIDSLTLESSKKSKDIDTEITDSDNERLKMTIEGSKTVDKMEVATHDQQTECGNGDNLSSKFKTKSFTEYRSEVVSPIRQKESGNGDNFGVMETPKAKCTHLMFTEERRVQQVYLVGNEPTKLDLDVLRAISLARNLDQYPCVQQWCQRVKAVPEERSKRWPTPARYRSQSALNSRTPTPSPQNISSTQRLLRYGSPIHASSPSRVLIGSPFLRSRHLSDPGGGRQQRRVAPGASHLTGLQGSELRQRLFP